jgi:predicted transcriptional regulator
MGRKHSRNGYGIAKLLCTKAACRFNHNYNLLRVKYRSRTDIVKDILLAANGGASKTKIMYRALVSYDQLREYSGGLIESDLLRFNEETSEYYTTEQGWKFLQLYNDMTEVMGEFRELSISA